MSPETPKEAVEASKDRFARLEGLLRRGSRIEGRLDAVETQLANVGGAVSDETTDTVAELCDGIRSDVETLRAAASEFLDAEADSRALYSMTSVFTSDLSEVAAHLPEGEDFRQDVEPFADTFEQVCALLESETTLLQAAIVAESGVGEPSVDEMDDLEPTTEALVSRVAELRAERKSISQELEDEGALAEFELTETAFFD